MNTPQPKSRIGDFLLEHGMVSREQLNTALLQQKSSGALLGEILVEQGLLTTAALVQVLSECIGVRGCVLRHGVIDAAGEDWDAAWGHTRKG